LKGGSQGKRKPAEMEIGDGRGAKTIKKRSQHCIRAAPKEDLIGGEEGFKKLEKKDGGGTLSKQNRIGSQSVPPRSSERIEVILGRNERRTLLNQTGLNWAKGYII